MSKKNKAKRLLLYTAVVQYSALTVEAFTPELSIKGLHFMGFYPMYEDEKMSRCS